MSPMVPPHAHLFSAARVAACGVVIAVCTLFPQHARAQDEVEPPAEVEPSAPHVEDG